MDLNFDIERNKITTILGFSGAGKSTLLKTYFRNHSTDRRDRRSPGSGPYLNLDKVELREFRRNYGMLFQYAALFDSFTAEENVGFPSKRIH